MTIEINSPMTAAPVAADEARRLEGRILFDNGSPARDIKVRLYSRGFGDTESRLGEVSTNSYGAYAFSYELNGHAPHLEVRAVIAQGDGSDKEVSLSATKYNAGAIEVMNLAVPASILALTPEYNRLTQDIKNQIGQSSLSDARENEDRQDVTLLRQATNWDARLIALAAAASKLSEDPLIKANGITQDELYALFRAGLPTDKEQLAGVSSETVKNALSKAKAAGIIELDQKEIDDIQPRFEEFARATLGASKAPGAPSNFSELLDKSGIKSSKDKAAFETLYLNHRGTEAELWQEAAKQGISAQSIDKLRLQGKLAHLTSNNPKLIESLQAQIGSMDALSQLVASDLDREETWKARLKAMAASHEEMENLIPTAYSGKDTEARLDAYAADLARKVRLSFPAQVVGRMVERNELVLGESHEHLAGPVQKFLNNATALNFDLGRVPFGAFVEQNRKEVFSGIDQKDIDRTVQGAKTLQRLYQLTPTDGAMAVLSQNNLDSAFDITAFTYEDFVDRFGDKFDENNKAASQKIAQLIYRKAQQVTAVVYNVLAAAKQMDTAPPVRAISPSSAIREAARGELIKQYPTMESLFGSLDFCECEHCRSVLSPAAYLVDLLQFLDPPKAVWDKFQDEMAAKHKAETNPPKYEKPYDVLLIRRPDLPHLPLTCENTNTALPYIDIVNEILEYYVAKNKLEPGAARDTGPATTPELLAEPQDAQPEAREAYEKLNSAKYPLALPFDLWLETVRQFFDHFKSPLWQVLEAFRQTDDLFPPKLNAKPCYYRAAIFAEYLGISPSEYSIFTDATLSNDLRKLYGFDDPNKTDSDNQKAALSELKFAKTLSRRLGVSYKQLIEEVSAGFINPKLDELVVLRKLGVGVDDAIRYKKNESLLLKDEKLLSLEELKLVEELRAFKQRLADLSTASGFNVVEWLDNTWKANEFNKILLFADPNAGSRFDQTILRYAGGTDVDVDALPLLKLNLFERLRKKLDWTIEEADRALQVFLPNKSLPLTLANIGEALMMALVYLAHLKALDEKLALGKGSRLKLLTLWSDLATTGKNPLYAQLFLTQSILKNDPVFDHPLGKYLSKPGILINDHLLTLQGALSLTADEIGQILKDAGMELDKAELSLANVSLLYRYGLLAKGVKLSVRDFITLKALSGLDPFRPLALPPPGEIKQDHPFSQTLRFVDIAEKIRDSGFGIEDLEYLLRHNFDAVGKYRTNREDLPALVKTLAAGLRRIQAENTLPDNPKVITDDLLREKLSLVLPSDVTDRFFGFWKDSIEFSEAKSDVAEANKLDPLVYEVEGIRVNYNAISQRQFVTHTGALTDDKKSAILAKLHPPLDTAPANEKVAYANFIALLNAIATKSQEQPKAFIEKYFDGFLAYDDIFGAAGAGLPIEEKRKKVLAAFLPFIQKRLSRQLVVETLIARLNADQTLTESLLTNASLLADAGQPEKALLDAFVTVADRGVSATFFNSPDCSGAPSMQTTIASPSTAARDASGKLIRPAGTKSARFEGYLEVSTAGAYRFFAALTKKDIAVEFHIGDLPSPLIRGKATKDGEEISQIVELKSAAPYRFTLDARNIGDGDVTLLIQGDNLPKDTLARLTLYPAAAAERAFVLLGKALQLIQGFELREPEVRYLLTHSKDFDDLNFSNLPARDSDRSVTDVTALFGQFLRLADYARLKREIGVVNDDLIGIFEIARRSYAASPDPDATKVKDICKRFAELTRREEAAAQAMADHLGFTSSSSLAAGDLAQEKGLLRLWEGLRVAGKLGIAVSAVAGSTNIVIPETKPDQRFAIARDLRNTVKARYEPENWQRIAQPISDKLRQGRRDALVAHVMHQEGFERIEQLFEYFWIDPGMEPIAQISRLRLAISSVQTFIQRCLMNLEPDVHPSSINSNHWKWMNRYRVWEANRKIFIHPENFLEPEFRDDKTYLFKELESALLEGDVTNDLAEDAFFKYLKGLEDIARLEIVTVYCEEKLLDPDSNVIHVIGRTYNLPRKYFYRRYAHRMWSAWEPVPVDIEGDHIVMAIWRERLHLFWVTFMEKADTSANEKLVLKDMVNLKGSEMKPARPIEVQLNWSEYFQGQWSARQASGFKGSFSPQHFDIRELFIFAHEEQGPEKERGIRINLGHPILGNNNLMCFFQLTNRNSGSEITAHGGLDILLNSPFPAKEAQGASFTASGSLDVTFFEELYTEEDRLLTTSGFTPPHKILKEGGDYRRVPCINLLSNLHDSKFPDYPSSRFWTLMVRTPMLLSSPFFYQDSQHTFFVEPTLTETVVEETSWLAPLSAEFSARLGDENRWEPPAIEAQFPAAVQDLPANDMHPLARFKIQSRSDWITEPGQLVKFDERLIDPAGGIKPQSPPTFANDGAESNGTVGR